MSNFKNIEIIRTDVIAGDRHIGVTHQLYELERHDGSRFVAGQLAACRRVLGTHGYSAEHTCFDERERDAAIAWWRAGAPELQPGTPARHIGDGGEVRCGDLFRDDDRRLCGSCCRSVDVIDTDGRIWGSCRANPEGCGDLLEQWPS